MKRRLFNSVLVGLAVLLASICSMIVQRPLVDANVFITRQWDSIEQFTYWYNQQGFTDEIDPTSAEKVDCDDYALRLQTRAMSQGYAVSIALSWQGIYYGVIVDDSGWKRGHAACLVDIGGMYYYVEPAPTQFSLIAIASRD